MCYNDEFRRIMEVYRQLRKESVIFPKREVRNQFLIKFDGQKSPIFETIEGNHIYEEPTKTLKKQAMYSVKEVNLFSDQPVVRAKKNSVSERQRQSRNGYTRPRLNASGTTGIRVGGSDSNRRVRRHTHFEQNPRPAPILHSEVSRMKDNDFLEAKSLMFVFDEILRNASETSDLEGRLTRRPHPGPARPAQPVREDAQAGRREQER